MCEACKADFGAIADREVRCRTSGCKKTWVWNRSDQLDACVARKPTPKAPHRMCESCIGIYQALRDVERPCRRSGCKRTWTDKRGGQLARAVRGKTGDPYPQYCEICAKEMGDLEDRQVACKTENCEGTWTWTKQAQLAAGVRPEPKVEEKSTTRSKRKSTPRPRRRSKRRAPKPEPRPLNSRRTRSAPTTVPETSAINGEAPAIAAANAGGDRSRGDRSGGKRGRNNKKKRRREIRPPERSCQSCNDFLKDKKTMEIPCKTCGTPIYWPPESQLQTHLGAWAAPAMCGACKRDAIEAARTIEREALRAAVTAAQPGAPHAEAASDASAPDPAPEPAQEPSEAQSEAPSPDAN